MKVGNAQAPNLQTGSRPQQRDLRTPDVVIGLAREGLPRAAIARGLSIPLAHVEQIIQRALVEGRLRVRPPLEHGDDDRTSEISRLRRRIADLEADIREISRTVSAAYERDARFEEALMHIGLTRRHADVVAFLVARSGIQRKAAIYAALYSADASGGPDPKIVDVFIHKIRHALKPWGVQIATGWGIGYGIDATNRAKLITVARAIIQDIDRGERSLSKKQSLEDSHDGEETENR